MTQKILNVFDRITSTYVEKTNVATQSTVKFQDHLHIRGENGDVNNKNQPNDRITSTYVEKTRKFIRILLHDRDHLHIRGENTTTVNACG